RFSLESTPTDTIDQARAKERAFATMIARDTSISRWKRIADAWCATWFGQSEIPPAAFGSLADAILTGAGALPMRAVEQLLAGTGAVRPDARTIAWARHVP